RWAALLGFAALLFAPGLALADDRYWLPLFTRYMALALFALSVDLVWGYTGLLSLGQGLYFGLGAYAVGYSLKLQAAAQSAGRPVGMVNLAKLDLFGHRFTGLSLYLLITGALAACTLLCYALVESKVGKVLTAIRDSEYRVLSLGYNTALYKTFVFALAGGI